MGSSKQATAVGASASLARQPPARHDRRWGDGPADQRDAFQRDRDRILYSTALRRLAGITQVVGAAEGHIFHNRLTHTLEVAQLARRLAEKLRGGQGELAATLGGIEPEVAEAAALAHDLGPEPMWDRGAGPSQWHAGLVRAPGRNRTCDTRFRKLMRTAACAGMWEDRVVAPGLEIA